MSATGQGGGGAGPLSPPSSALGTLLRVLTSTWAKAAYTIVIAEIWVAVNIASFMVGGAGKLVDIFTADGTFALALAAVLTILNDRAERREDLRERANERRRQSELHRKEIEPHLTLETGNRTVELPITSGGAPGGSHEDAFLVLKNVGPGIAADLHAALIATLRPIAEFLPDDADPTELKPKVDPRRLRPLSRDYLKPGEEWIVWDPDEWERGLRVWEEYFDFEDDELIAVKVQVSTLDLEENKTSGVEATFTRSDPPDKDDDPRQADYWTATMAGKSRWYLSEGPSRIPPQAQPNAEPGAPGASSRAPG